MKRIKELRQAKGLRQVDMAAHFGVGQTAIVKWESEGLYPPSRLLPDIAIYLGCTLDDLYKDEKEAMAERWLCSPDYVRMIIREGKLSAVNLGGWKIRWDEVYRYEKEREKADTEMLRQQRLGFVR